MKKHQPLLLVLFLLLTTSVNAQLRVITGQVKNQNNEPVLNATVTVRNSSIAKQTDSTGHFSISVPASATTLVISYVGFKTEEVAIGGRSDISITLSPGSAALQDVVVTALGAVSGVDMTAQQSAHLILSIQTQGVGVETNEPERSVP